MKTIKENSIRITEYNVADKLPDPFKFDDGTFVKSREDWEKRKKEIYKTAVELQYGTQPPAPEVLSFEVLDESYGSYRITAGTKERQVSFIMRALIPVGNGPRPNGPFPVIVDGDLCFKYAFLPDYVPTMLENGIAYVTFNRLELAPDRQDIGRKGPLYEVYPDKTFGAIGAWAWGYSRCVDVLEQLPFTDKNNIAFTGHSRGGKTAMLAGVMDERAAVVNPNETCAGACSCYRVSMKAVDENGEEKESETLSSICERYPLWFGPELIKYAGTEGELPFDSHFLKALVAPRILLEGEAASDIWANPVGSWQTIMGAKEVFDFLDAGDNLIWYYRSGGHFHKGEDIENLVAVMKNRMYSSPLPEGFFTTPFKPMDRIFDWKAPDKKQ